MYARRSPRNSHSTADGRGVSFADEQAAGNRSSFFDGPKRDSNSGFFGNESATNVTAQGLAPSPEEEISTDPIDTIFAYLDPRESGALRTGDLDMVLDTIGENDDMPNVLRSLGSQTKMDTLTRDDLRRILFSKKERTVMQECSLFVLMVLLPALYSASTRLPFICLAIEVTKARGGALWQVSILLGTYQTSRALANFIISVFGGPDPMYRLHMIMILTGGAGWFVAGLPQFTSVWTLFALVGVGLSESVVNLQTTVILETAAESPSNVADPLQLAHRIRVQYAAVAGGVFVCWLIGGWIYTHMGFQYVTWLGMACHIGQFVCTLFFQKFSASAANRNERRSISKRDAELLPTRHTDGRVFLRSVTYRIKAMVILAKEAAAVFEGVPTQPFANGSFDQAAILAQEDLVLIGSLKLLYRAFFRRLSTGKRPSLMVRQGTRKAKPRLSVVDSAGALTSMLRNIEETDLEGSVKNLDATMVDCADIAIQLMDMDGDGQVTEREFVSFLAPRVYAEVFEVGINERKHVDIIWPYMKAIVFTQAIMAFCIGCFLSTALLMYTERFGLTAAMVGLLLAIGEGIGAFNIYAFSAWRSWTYRKKQDSLLYEEVEKPSLLGAICNRPLHVPFCLFIVGCSTMGYTSKIFALAVTFQMIMSAMNDPSVSFLNELIATSIPSKEFRKYQGAGQWLRRLGNVVTGVFGPWLFGAYKDLPFLLFGGIVTAWGFVIWYLMWQHARKVEEDIGKEVRSKNILMAPFNPFLETSRTPWHMMEQQYYVKNRESIRQQLAPGRSHALNLAILESRMRRIGAYQRMLEVELKHEKQSREDLEVRLSKMERAESTQVLKELSTHSLERRFPVHSDLPPLRPLSVLHHPPTDDSFSSNDLGMELAPPQPSSSTSRFDAPERPEQFLDEDETAPLKPMFLRDKSPPHSVQPLLSAQQPPRSTPTPPPKRVAVLNPQDHDVLCGRGETALAGHPGNQTYRLLVNLNKRLYAACLASEKQKISRSIVAAIREQKGRFLEFDPEAGAWVDVGDDMALEKTTQALEEGQVDLRRK